jgi:hypothetical protein
MTSAMSSSPSSETSSMALSPSSSASSSSSSATAALVEAGPHAALIAKGGLYARFWARQSGGFIGMEAAE